MTLLPSKVEANRRCVFYWFEHGSTSSTCREWNVNRPMVNKQWLLHDNVGDCAVGTYSTISPQAWNPTLGACQGSWEVRVMSNAVLCWEHSFQVSHLRNPLSEPMRICEWLTTSRLSWCLASLLLLDLNSYSHPLVERRPCLCQMSWMKSCCLLPAEHLRLAGPMGRYRKRNPQSQGVVKRLLPCWARSLLDVPPERMQPSTSWNSL